jgi:DNA-binding protein YbaB
MTAELHDWQRRQQSALEDWQRKSTAVRAALAQLKANAVSRDGAVSVTVDAKGHLLGIRLTPQATRLGEIGLASVLLDTIRRAETDAARLTEEVMRPLTGDPRMIETVEAARQLMGQASQPSASQQSRGMTEEEMDEFYARFSDDPFGHNRGHR